jgi:GDP-L-fucose synthase
MDKTSRIFLAGHRGLVGSAILRRLQADGFANVVVRSHAELDLTDAPNVDAFFKSEQPSHVFMAAARVGGIVANNSFGADFLRVNLQIQTNVIDAAHRFGAQKLLFLGSSCIYPKFAAQPIREDSLLTGPLEPTNEAYGPNDNFDLTSSHVLPALMRKMHEAKLAGAPSVAVWGSGTPRRELLHVDDMADACLFLMNCYSSGDIVNVGVGEDIPIADLAHLIAEIVGYKGELAFDASKPDGTPRKLLDVSRLTAAGWTARTPLRDGIAKTYRWYLDHVAAGAARGVAAQ